MDCWWVGRSIDQSVLTAGPWAPSIESTKTDETTARTGFDAPSIKSISGRGPCDPSACTYAVVLGGAFHSIDLRPQSIGNAVNRAPSINAGGEEQGIQEKEK